jgi:hypothetical protein
VITKSGEARGIKLWFQFLLKNEYPRFYTIFANSRTNSL